MRRRTFTLAAATASVAAAAPAAQARTGRPPHGAADRTKAHTTAGVVQGERVEGITVFRGVPYAEPPVGRLRFAAPRPPEPWAGIRDATRFGPISPQPTGDTGSEDCLYANVWTPDTAGSRPVLVFIHGGGWRLGAGSLANYDGARLAARGDIVVVTFNYRLNVFGWGMHEELVDPETGDDANWGLADQAALLHWVHANAAAFGGDPANITLSGSSAGGSSTWQLSLRPDLRHIVRRAIPISAAHAWTPAIGLTPADARTTYELLADEFQTSVRGLRTVPTFALRDAFIRLFGGLPQDRKVASAREYPGPIAHGRWMPGFDYELPTPAVPLLVIGADTEASFFTGPNPPSPPPTPAPTDDATLREAVHAVLLKGATEVTDGEVDACIAAYREASVADGLPTDPVSIWTEIWGDGIFRYQDIRLAERHARIGTTPAYVMHFAQPVLAPWFGTPHEATSKFLFGSYRLPENLPQFGDGPRQEAVSNTFMDVVASFAHDGRPGSSSIPRWPAFRPDRDTTLTLGGADLTRLGPTPKSRQLTYWDHAGWVPRVRSQGRGGA